VKKRDTLEKLALEVGAAMSNRGYSLVTAESCTGGWIAKVITDVAGSSGWFDRGFITYSNRSKCEQLGVDAGLIAEYGAVSAEVVEAMATGALKYSAADIAVAVSGIAGPAGGSPEKPVGTVWFAWAFRGNSGPQAHCEQSHFSGDREKIRCAAVARGLAGILDMLVHRGDLKL
jgi:nicotinamide-nucleotide amidase